MVKIRLKRMGAKKNPFYRVVVSESRNARNGKSIANLGYYNPMTEPAEIKIDVEAATDGIGKGAQPSETVKKLLKIAGLE